MLPSYDLTILYILVSCPNMVNNLYKDLYNNGCTEKLYTYTDLIIKLIEKGIIGR